MADYSKLHTYKEWATALAKLLTQAQDAIAQNKLQPKRDAQVALREFIAKCSADERAKELDEIAGDAIYNIFEATMEQGLAEMGSRSAELAALTKQVEAESDANASTASLMRFEAAKKAIDTTVEAIAALKSIRLQLDSSQQDEKRLGDSIDTLIADIQRIRNQVELLDHPV